MSEAVVRAPAGCLKRLGLMYSARARQRRGDVLRARLALNPEHRILDLGGGDGSHVQLLFPAHRSVVVADIDPRDLERARSRYHYETVQIDAQHALPFEDNEFDFVFCSSVIEHTTGPKLEMTQMTDSARFKRVAWEHQQHFAREIQRIGKSYWVQTPNKYFVVESHSWLPGIVAFLPRRVLIPLLKVFARFWPKATLPDWNLLNEGDMRALFQDAEIIREKSCGLTKSIVAFKALDDQAGGPSADTI